MEKNNLKKANKLIDKVFAKLEYFDNSDLNVPTLEKLLNQIHEVRVLINK